MSRGVDSWVVKLTYESWNRRVVESTCEVVESAHESWSRIMSLVGVDLWVVESKSCGVDLWSRRVDSRVVESTQESWSRLMSGGIEKFWSRTVELAHESWSRTVEWVVESNLWLKLHEIYSYYNFLKNGHFQNRLHDSTSPRLHDSTKSIPRLHDSTVKNEPASDSTVLCNREKWSSKSGWNILTKPHFLGWNFFFQRPLENFILALRTC